jgi:hypothetical protein
MTRADAPPLEAERVCIIVGCCRERGEDDKSFCAPHRYWASYVLSRPFYRDHEPPDVDERGAIQEPLEALLSAPETRAYAHLGGAL